MTKRLITNWMTTLIGVVIAIIITKDLYISYSDMSFKELIISFFFYGLSIALILAKDKILLDSWSYLTTKISNLLDRITL
jgi:hypothetical protein